jgi:excisionase family DNA binding protein
MELINLKEGALALRISVPTLRRLIKEGKLPYRRIGGGKIFFLAEDLENFLRECLVQNSARSSV